LLDAYQRAGQWEFYDSVLSKQDDHIRQKLPDAPSGTDPASKLELDRGDYLQHT